MEIKNTNFLIYGIGKSGISAYNFLKQNNAKNIYFYDDNINNLKIKNNNNLLNNKKIKIIQKIEEILKLNIKYVVLSPGINIIDNKNINFLKNNNIIYFSEFYLGFIFSKGKKICVTGTNGKTTTTNLIYHILKQKNNNVFLCGNTNCPITQIANQTTKNSLLVCELSSFALETVGKNFCPDISVVLNITTDHIIRHKTWQNYFNCKLNITKYQTKNNYLIKNNNLKINSNAKIINFDLINNKCNCYSKNKKIYFNNKKIIKTKIINLLGKYNLQNVLSAVAVCKVLNIKTKIIKKGIKTFLPLDHRLQIVYKKNDITFVDDSKATNPSSTICALCSIKKPIILLLGGSDKGYVYDEIFNYTTNVKHIITFGQMSKKIATTAKNNNFKNVTSFNTMFKAVYYAKKLATSGDVVLLSPACASFDEFSSYKQRGNMFLSYIKT